LYSDSNVLNKENVLKGAEEAKAAIGNVALKHDPTKDVQQYYEQRSAKVPQQHLLVSGRRNGKGIMINVPIEAQPIKA
jgi:hypothetical protein